MNSAVILAGGRGERLRPLTQDKPKCMVEVLGNPILAYQINWLKAHGITRIVVACGYLHEMIKSYFGNGSSMGVSIEYVIEDAPLGRGGALKAAMKTLDLSSAEPIVALNGDNVTNLSLTEVVDFHKKQKCLATIVTIPFKSSFGIVEIDSSSRVIGFREKPELPYFLNAGIYVVEPALIDHLPDKGDHETDTFPKLVERQMLAAYSSRAFWRTIDTVKDVSELKGELESIFLGALFRPQPTKHQ